MRVVDVNFTQKLRLGCIKRRDTETWRLIRAFGTWLYLCQDSRTVTDQILTGFGSSLLARIRILRLWLSGSMEEYAVSIFAHYIWLILVQPGASSMVGLLQEHGPCRINNDSATVSHNQYSWNNEVNMLYIDQPIGV